MAFSDFSPQGEEEILTKKKVNKPPLYRVVLLNDDYTLMNFVIMVLQKFFSKTLEEATAIMLEVHHKGRGVCGVYSHEIAETKARQVMECAMEQKYPLRCVVEKE